MCSRRVVEGRRVLVASRSLAGCSIRSLYVKGALQTAVHNKCTWFWALRALGQGLSSLRVVDDEVPHIKSSWFLSNP